MSLLKEKKVHCNQHGQTNAAYACSHSVSSLQDEERRGLVFVRDEDGQYNGWCDECDSFLMLHGGEWNDETEAFAKIRLLCEFCFEQLVELNKTS